MTILIFSRSAMSFSPYHDWLADADAALVLLTSADKLDLPAPAQAAALTRYAEVRCYDDYAAGTELERDAMDLGGQVSAVVALSELDLIRVGALREHLGIPGQGRDSAIAFRDKVEMKRVLAAGGVAVTAFAAVSGPVDLYRFVARHGFPVVVKPRHGFGSMGVTVLRDREELDAFAAEPLTPRVESVPDLMVESFVEGEQYHVDGIVLGGELRLAWPSRYLNDPAAFGSGAGLASVMTDPGDPLTLRLLQVLRESLSAMPSPPDFTFHCEVFHTPDDRLLVGEIASRTGGARVNDTVREAFGVNLNRSIVRAQAGLPVPLPEAGLLTQAGWALIGPRAGRIGDVPPTAPMDWVRCYRAEVRDGDDMRPADSSVSCVASAVIVGADAAQVAARIQEFTAWFWDCATVDVEVPVSEHPEEKA